MVILYYWRARLGSVRVLAYDASCSATHSTDTAPSSRAYTETCAVLPRLLGSCMFAFPRNAPQEHNKHLIWLLLATTTISQVCQVPTRVAVTSPHCQAQALLLFAPPSTRSRGSCAGSRARTSRTRSRRRCGTPGTAAPSPMPPAAGPALAPSQSHQIVLPLACRRVVPGSRSSTAAPPAPVAAVPPAWGPQAGRCRAPRLRVLVPWRRRHPAEPPSEPAQDFMYFID